jgi:YVTN family beta-propeller protein
MGDESAGSHRRAGGRWWHRLGVGVAAVLVLLGSAVTPASRHVLAEAPLGTPIPASGPTFGVAVNALTNRVYLANPVGNTLTVLDGATNKIVGSPIQVVNDPEGVAVNPATYRVYVASTSSDSVTVIDGAANTIIGNPITVGPGPRAIEVNTVTNRVYVANLGSDAITTIGIPFTIGASTVTPGSAITATWSSLFAPNAGDFVGLFEL